jgi:glycosyltransferase involved in cell wall biosynthesis
MMVSHFSNDHPLLKVHFSGMVSWHMGHTAREAERLGALSGYWTGNKCPASVSNKYYKRIWPYHLAQKAFYHLPFTNTEEWMRWINLPFYDAWVLSQRLPKDTQVVQGPMGSCRALFKLADRSQRKIVKVFDAPNTHPRNCTKVWQDECDKFCKGYTIPMPLWVLERISHEIDQADLVLCPSLAVRDSMIAYGVPTSKCIVRHFGVDLSVFKQRDRIPSYPRFVCVGSICLRKGHQYLFRAFAELKTSLPDAELICVGGVRPDFKNEWPQWKDSITYYPGLAHKDLAELLRTCTAFVFPSLEEGFARVLSEAMASGLPIIATHESGATTVVKDGCEGIIVPTFDVRSLCEAMSRLASDDDLNRHMGNAAYIAGAAKNSWSDYTKFLLSEYSARI